MRPRTTRGSYFDNLYHKSMKSKQLPHQDIMIAQSKTRKTLNDLMKGRELELNSIVSTRDFIHNSLYNPFYGYFSMHAKVLDKMSPSRTQSLDFKSISIKNNDDFLWKMANVYSAQDNDHSDRDLQLWHTPTEIFQPFYGYAIAKYMVKQFKDKSSSYNLMNPSIFKIVEIGAGNGTLMRNIIEFLQANEPDIYQKTSYEIIEISPQLAKIQTDNLRKMSLDALQKVKITNRSVFDYNQTSKEPCFFIAMEVLDNLSHDLVRYDMESGQAVQGMVQIDETGDFEQVYEQATDPLLLRYLEVRQSTGFKSPVHGSSFTKFLNSINPFQANLSPPEFVPTNAFHLLERIFKCFPNHHLIMSDFHSLPEATSGIDAPVVQTRYQRKMVPCSSYMVEPGYFDIFFPTNFQLMGQIYQALAASNRNHDNSPSQVDVCVQSHRDFVKANAVNLADTATASGENPMVDYYENVSFLLVNR